MILAKTKYKTCNEKLLAIFKAFKIWKHQLKNFQLEVLVFTNHNNLQKFIDIKNLSLKQVHWVQKLF